jgi:hypothetical protein
LAACCEKRSATAANDTILFALFAFRIDDRWRAANRTSKFLTHRFYLAKWPPSIRLQCTTAEPLKCSGFAVLRPTRSEQASALNLFRPIRILPVRAKGGAHDLGSSGPKLFKCQACGSIQGPMALARIFPKIGGFPELRSYRCVVCDEVLTLEHEA